MISLLNLGCRDAICITNERRYNDIIHILDKYGYCWSSGSSYIKWSPYIYGMNPLRKFYLFLNNDRYKRGIYSNNLTDIEYDNVYNIDDIIEFGRKIMKDNLKEFLENE
jgi:virulence-associated protein VapD